MEYICSDTNVWLDFWHISRIKLPFLLEVTYLMCEDTISDEVLSAGMRESLIENGLQSVQLSEEEFYLTEEYAKYKKLSVHDRMALAIAKQRKIILLTGDMALRKAAIKENVPVLGTIGLLDRMFSEKAIAQTEYKECLIDLKNANGGRIRLPQEELLKRINNL